MKNGGIKRKKGITLRCDICGKDGTLHITRTRVPLSIQDFKFTKDNCKNPVKEEFKRRRLNRYKHLSFTRLMTYLYGGKEQVLDEIANERPVLTTSFLPSVRSNQSSDSEIARIDNETIEIFVDSILKLKASVLAKLHILHLLVESKLYPGPLAHIVRVNLIEGEKIEHELWKSVDDNRMQRSLVEWLLIVRKAEKSSPYAAARKYFAYSSNGKRLHLNTRHIKEKQSKVNEFWDRFSHTYDKYLRTQGILMDIICEDPELYSEYQESMNRYRNQIQEPWKQKDKDGISLGESKEALRVKYKIYYHFSIRHYDPELYETQIQRHDLNPKDNPKPTGIVEHKLHKSKVPRSVIEELEKEDRM